MKSEKEIIEKAVKAITDQTALKIKYQPDKSNEKWAGYDIEITLPENSDSRKVKYLVEVKRSFSNAKMGDAAIKAKNSSKEYLLVTEYITQPQTEKLRQLGVNFFDGAGNAYLNAPGIYIFISGKKTEVNEEKPISIFRPAGIKLLLALLTNPGFENADYRTIAAEAGVTKTTVGRIFEDLQRSGYLIKKGKNERSLTKKQELIKRWAINYSEQFRSKLKPVRFHSTKQTGTRWWEEINIKDYKAVWGGETGGAELTKHLKPQTATIYADSVLPKLQAKYGLVRYDKGEIEILRKFWTSGEVSETVAPPLVVYADLLGSADERNLETAREIYDKYLAQIAEENS